MILRSSAGMAAMPNIVKFSTAKVLRANKQSLQTCLEVMESLEKTLGVVENLISACPNNLTKALLFKQQRLLEDKLQHTKLRVLSL
jgi:hypothetical protein